MEIWHTLTGTIDPKVVNDAIFWINSQLYSHPVKKLIFIISSNGGDIDSSIRLHDYLVSLPIEVTTCGFGQVDSAAINVFLAGNIRLCLPNCRFRVHEGKFHVSDKATALEHIVEATGFLKEMDRRSNEIPAEKIGKPIEEIAKIKKVGLIVTGADAVKLKIATGVVDKLPVSQQVFPKNG
ncbi:ATP-dependent Clp protease proteolytic subunit [Candidatus Amesbacteria bacterium]|nr:ATP-dependent Clp protease proteolytic subunit [Candidatus Amesbacteria bacterium]MBI2587398.1 ATP-dependent Clp protease proteolytic subunit [Candidatus Amesbacteria bacterium]